MARRLSRPHVMQLLARWHIWLGWLVGVPILMWTVTGLVMVLYPLADVRGEALRAGAPVFATKDLVFPTERIGAITHAELTMQADGPVWIVTEPGGGRYRYSARDGSLVPPVIASEAQRIAAAAWAGDAALEGVTYFPADAAPDDLRSPINSWQAHFADGTNLYIRADTGEIIATRTGWWRIYDTMWGLHIMDLQTRENTSHPILILFAALAVLSALLGCTLMFRRRRARPAMPRGGQ